MLGSYLTLSLLVGAAMARTELTDTTEESLQSPNFPDNYPAGWVILSNLIRTLNKRVDFYKNEYAFNSSLIEDKRLFNSEHI